MSDYGTDIVTVGRALPKLAHVEPGNGRFDVRVTWASGERAGRTDTVDLAPMVFTFKVFKPLRDGTVAIDAVRLGDYGASIVWPGNDDLDIGADAIEEMAAEIMTGADFSAFLKRSALTFDAAAAQLGIARRLVAYYAKGREIPRYIALACKQLDLMLGGEVATCGALDMHARAEAGEVIMAGGSVGAMPLGTYMIGSDGKFMQTPIAGTWSAPEDAWAGGRCTVAPVWVGASKGDILAAGAANPKPVEGLAMVQMKPGLYWRGRDK